MSEQKGSRMDHIYDLGLDNYFLNSKQKLLNRRKNIEFLKIVNLRPINRYHEKSKKTNHKQGENTCKTFLK